MIEIIHSETFLVWFSRLKDLRAKARIQARLDRCEAGNPGDMKALREGIFELRVDYGPGYRVYCIRRGLLVIVLLAGGDKSTQTEDIRRAVEISKEWRD